MEKVPKGLPMRYRRILDWARRHLCFLIGLVILLVCEGLFLFAGDSIPVTPHDQLDAMVPLAELSAKHLGDAYYPELMGGMPASAASMGIPGMELFYLLFPAILAYSLNLCAVLMVAYCSMYACLIMMGVRSWASAIAAFMFACLPFYSVFALSCMGVPLVVCAILQMLDERRFAGSVVLAAVFGIWSSFTFIGYAICITLFVIIVVLAVKGFRKKAIRLSVVLLVLLCIYAISSIDMIASIFTSGEAGHRAEYGTEGDSFSLSEAILFLQQGQYHAVSDHLYIMWMMITVVVCFAMHAIWDKVRYSRIMPGNLKRLWVALVVLLMVAFAIALFEEFYASDLGYRFRSILPSSLGSIQLDRFYWLYPAIWYIGAGISFELVMRIANNKHLSVIGLLVVVITAVLTLSLSVPNNDLFKNTKDVVIDHEHDSLTWEQFYSEDLFEKVKKDLNQREGKDESSYRVGSIGMHPLVALHSGFYTLDGYSSNYPLSYKHNFAEIIEPELDSSQELYDYYWNWGNRCYLLSHELEKDFLIGADSGKRIDDLRLNIKAFKEMGGDYILSAVPINNHEKVGLDFVGEYSDNSALYRIWVYDAI